MWKHAFQSFALASLACIAVAAPVSADELYNINLSPPVHVGEKFQYQASETESSHTYRKRGDVTSLTSAESSTITLDSNVAVETCDQRGQPGQLKFRVNSLHSPTQNMVLVEPGSEITARTAMIAAQPPRYISVFAKADEPVHPIVAAAMRRVVSISSETESSEQQAFGTDKAIPVGGRWSLDGDPGARLLAKMQIKADPKTVTGTAQLVMIARRGASDCLKVQMEVHCDELTPTVAPGETLIKASVTAYATYYVAKDTSRVVESSYQATVEMQVQGKAGDDAYTDTRWASVSRDMDIADVPK